MQLAVVPIPADEGPQRGPSAPSGGGLLELLSAALRAVRSAAPEWLRAMRVASGEIPGSIQDAIDALLDTASGFAGAGIVVPEKLLPKGSKLAVRPMSRWELPHIPYKKVEILPTEGLLRDMRESLVDLLADETAEVPLLRELPKVKPVRVANFPGQGGAGLIPPRAVSKQSLSPGGLITVDIDEALEAGRTPKGVIDILRRWLVHESQHLATEYGWPRHRTLHGWAPHIPVSEARELAKYPETVERVLKAAPPGRERWFLYKHNYGEQLANEIARRWLQGIDYMLGNPIDMEAIAGDLWWL